MLWAGIALMLIGLGLAGVGLWMMGLMGRILDALRKGFTR